jgi:aryl carrier-like protein
MSDDLAEAYERAARLLGTSVEDLEKKYGHLNNGLQMMNLRNRLRAKGHNV